MSTSSLPSRKLSKRSRYKMLESELKKEWKQAHPEPAYSLTRYEHILRAKSVGLPDGVAPNSLIALAMNSYFDNRLEMTAEKADEMGEPNPAAATAKLVYQQLAGDKEQPISQEVTDISLGIHLAKTALRSTMLGFDQ